MARCLKFLKTLALNYSISTLKNNYLQLIIFLYYWTNNLRVKNITGFLGLKNEGRYQVKITITNLIL